MPLSEAISFMRKNWKVYLAFLGGSPFMIILLYSIQAWSPTLLIRVHEWDISDAGRMYGLVALSRKFGRAIITHSCSFDAKL